MITLTDYIKKHGLKSAAEKLDFSEAVLYRLKNRGAVVIKGAVYAPIIKRATRKDGKK